MTMRQVPWLFQCDECTPQDAYMNDAQIKEMRVLLKNRKEMWNTAFNSTFILLYSFELGHQIIPPASNLKMLLHYFICHAQESLRLVYEAKEFRNLYMIQEKIEGHEIKNICTMCDKPAPNRCSACNCVFYCSKEHQKLHWSTDHKINCVSYKEIIPVLWFDSVTQFHDVIISLVKGELVNPIALGR
jgi:hypothetical protein